MRLLEAVDVRWRLAAGKERFSVPLSSPLSSDSRSSNRLLRDKFIFADHQEGREFAVGEAAPADVPAEDAFIPDMSTTKVAGTATGLDLDENAEYSCSGRLLGGSFESSEPSVILAFCLIVS